MNAKLNCWQAKDCGRGPEGRNVAELGVCPAVTATEVDGLNGGDNGGRVCWAVAGTFCGGEVQGSFAEKRLTCMNCEHYLQVEKDEGTGFRVLTEGQRYHPPKAG